VCEAQSIRTIRNLAEAGLTGLLGSMQHPASWAGAHLALLPVDYCCCFACQEQQLQVCVWYTYCPVSLYNVRGMHVSGSEGSNNGHTQCAGATTNCAVAVLQGKQHTHQPQLSSVILCATSFAIESGLESCEDSRVCVGMSVVHSQVCGVDTLQDHVLFV